MNEQDQSPNLDQAVEFLSNPKLKLSGRIRRRLMRARCGVYLNPPPKQRKARVTGVSARLDKANAKRDSRRRSAGASHPRIEPLPAGEKYICRLADMTFRQLIRRLKQAARVSSHYRHVIERSPTSIFVSQWRAIQDSALICLRHLQTEIKFRTEGRKNPGHGNAPVTA